MPAYKNKDSGSWYVVTQYTDWTGERKQKCKRGFDTKREALEWEQKFQQQNAGDLDMTFEAFYEIYTNDLVEAIAQRSQNIKWETTVDKRKRVIEGYRAEDLAQFNPHDDFRYYLTKLVQRIEHLDINWKTQQRATSSYEGAMDILDFFKQWITSQPLNTYSVQFLQLFLQPKI